MKKRQRKKIWTKIANGKPLNQNELKVMNHQLRRFFLSYSRGMSKLFDYIRDVFSKVDEVTGFKGL